LDTKYFTENDELLSPILNYFEDTWIGRRYWQATKKGDHLLLKFRFGTAYSLDFEDLPRTIMVLKDGTIVLHRF